MKLKYSVRVLISLCLVVLVSCSTPDPIVEDYTNCTIYRDQWGVPHIHGKTDRDVAYGLAWAGCEDDFMTLQEQMLAIKGLYGQVKGMDGVIADIAIQYMGIREHARGNMDQLDERTRLVIDGYVSGVNAYMLAHPEEVALEDLYPVEAHDLVAGYLLGLVEISGAGSDLAKLADGSIVQDLHPDAERGSNAIAVSASRTVEGETFLAINSHQPMEGWYSWYEAHLISDEGLNILGGTFPGAATIFHGTNEHLGWAHTVNHADFSDVYKLTMHPDKKGYYKLGQDWLPLTKKTIRSWVKLFGPLKIPVTRTIYSSEYGVTFRIGDEYFAWRYQAKEAVKAIEQWYKMNRATNWSEWRAALDIKGIPCTNIVYADREDNIYYVSNARHPHKDPSIDWKGIVNSADKDALWSDQDWSIDSLPNVYNPASGYVFNTNNTPYSASGDDDNPTYKEVQGTMHFLEDDYENNRSLRLQELIDDHSQLSYKDFLNIKFDQTYPTPLRSIPYNEEMLLQQDASVDEEIAIAIQMLNSWNRSTSPDNEAAALFLLSREALRQIHRKKGKIDSSDFVEAIKSASNEMLASFGKLNVALGAFQRHKRADVDIPIGGGSDVLGAIYCRKMDDGRYRAFSGESYIQMVRFDSINGPKIETIHAFGSSARPTSPHYTDQMQLFVDQKLKPMTLDLEEVKKSATRHYHPKAVRQI